MKTTGVTVAYNLCTRVLVTLLKYKSAASLSLSPVHIHISRNRAVAPAVKKMDATINRGSQNCCNETDQ